jgi:Reverse transcriptase (RNA-dependent DNA polymerase)
MSTGTRTRSQAARAPTGGRGAGRDNGTGGRGGGAGRGTAPQQPLPQPPQPERAATGNGSAAPANAIFTVQKLDQVKHIGDLMTPEALDKISQATTANPAMSLDQIFGEQVQRQIAGRLMMIKEYRSQAIHWRKFGYAKLLTALRRVVTEGKEANSDLSLMAILGSKNSEYKFTDLTREVVEEMLLKLQIFLEARQDQVQRLTSKEAYTLFKNILDRSLSKYPPLKAVILDKWSKLSNEGTQFPTTNSAEEEEGEDGRDADLTPFEHFYVLLHETLVDQEEAVRKSAMSQPKANSSKRSAEDTVATIHDKPAKHQRKEAKKSCRGCGNWNCPGGAAPSKGNSNCWHLRTGQHQKPHAWFNSDESIEWLAHMTANHAAIVPKLKPKCIRTPRDKQGEKHEHDDDDILIERAYINNVLDKQTDRDLIRCTIQAKNGNVIHIQALIDGGCLSTSYVNTEIMQWLEDRGHEFKCPNGRCTQVCSAFNGECRRDRGQTTIRLNYNYENDLSKSDTIKMSIRAHDMRFQLIISKQDMIQNLLAAKFPSHFFPPGYVVTCSAPECTLERASDMAAVASIRSKEELLDVEPDDPFSVGHQEARPPREAVPADTGEPALLSIPDGEDIPPGFELPNIYGTPTEREAIFDLVWEFKDVFSTKPRSTPAINVGSYELKVDEGLWQTPANQGPPRLMSQQKEQDLRENVEDLVKNNVVQPSTAGYYSHPVLVPKPNDPKTGERRRDRMTVDFRNLNRCTADNNKHPLPNIKHMLERIAQHQPTKFATFDLVDGYHQAPLNENSRKFTAFMTWFGVFEYLRLPQGLKGAGAFFQSIMTGIVLVGLLYICSEAYLDDVLTHGQDHNFMDNLRETLGRFRRHGIICNPRKTHLGLETVNFCGHEFNKEGRRFDREKLDSIYNIQKRYREKLDRNQ